jgi:hypothetical protein
MPEDESIILSLDAIGTTMGARHSQVHPGDVVRSPNHVSLREVSQASSKSGFAASLAPAVSAEDPRGGAIEEFRLGDAPLVRRFRRPGSLQKHFVNALSNLLVRRVGTAARFAIALHSVNRRPT